MSRNRNPRENRFRAKQSGQQFNAVSHRRIEAEAETPKVVPFTEMPVLNPLNPKDYFYPQMYVSQVLGPRPEFKEAIEEIIIGMLTTTRGEVVQPDKNYPRHERPFIPAQIAEYRDTLKVLEISGVNTQRKYRVMAQAFGGGRYSPHSADKLLADFSLTQHHHFTGIEQMKEHFFPVNDPTNHIVLIDNLAGLVDDEGMYDESATATVFNRYPEEVERYKDPSALIDSEDVEAQLGQIFKDIGLEIDGLCRDEFSMGRVKRYLDEVQDNPTQADEALKLIYDSFIFYQRIAPEVEAEKTKLQSQYTEDNVLGYLIQRNLAPHGVLILSQSEITEIPGMRLVDTLGTAQIYQRKLDEKVRLIEMP
jgi:hypothetical protein